MRPTNLPALPCALLLNLPQLPSPALALAALAPCPRPNQHQTAPASLPAFPSASLPASLLACLQRLLDYIKPDKVHIMQDGRIVTTGDMGLVDKLELEGYSVLSNS